MTEQEIMELQERNAKRAQEAIKQLGEKYLCHPSNQITKKKFKKELARSKKLCLNV